MEVFAQRGIIPIFWPPFPPDLSPIESIWDRMKDILRKLEPAVHHNYRRLRAAVIEAWDSITDAEIRDMIHTMPDRCRDVIVAN
jgi:transposase